MMMAGTAEFLHCTTPITTANKSPRPSDRPHSSIAEYIGKLGIPKGRHAERRGEDVNTEHLHLFTFRGRPKNDDEDGTKAETGYTSKRGRNRLF